MSCNVYLLQTHEIIAPRKNRILSITPFELCQTGCTNGGLEKSQVSLFHPIHNVVVYRTSPHRDRHRVEERLKKSTFRKYKRDSDSPYSLIIEVSQWEITLPLGHHF